MNVVLRRIQKTIRHNFLPENRTTTIIEIIAVFIWMASTFVFYLIISEIIPELEFLDSSTTVNIIATFFIADGLIYSLLFRNLHDLGAKIESGHFNKFLLLPTNTINYVSFRNIQFSSSIQIPISIVLLVLWGSLPAVSTILWYVFSIILGFLIAFQIWVMFGLLSFWFKLGEHLTILFEELSSIGMFPLRFFVGTAYLYLFFPFLLISSGSMELLFDYVGLEWVLKQLVFLFLIFILNRFLFSAGLKRYRVS